MDQAHTPENEADYATLWNSIHDHGVMETWNNRRYRYWYPGNGFRYWYMGALYNRDGGIEGRFVSKIINRSRAEQIEPIAAELQAKAAEWKRREKTEERASHQEPADEKKGQRASAPWPVTDLEVDVREDLVEDAA